MKLSGAFDGEEHLLKFREDFGIVEYVLDGLEELDEEEDELTGYEVPSRVAVTSQVMRATDPRFSQRDMESGWGAHCVVMSALCMILAAPKEQYQHNFYNVGRVFVESTFTFKTKDFFGERI